MRVAGKCIYLGRYDSAESRERYESVNAEWVVQGKPLVSRAVGEDGPTITQIIIAFWEGNQTSYAPYSAVNLPVSGKRPTGELGNFFDALKPLRRLYGKIPASEFGPLKLKALRAAMINMGWCRNVINRQISRIKHVFAWALSEELLGGDQAGKRRPGDKRALPTPNNLWTVTGLKPGRSEARETQQIKPIAAHIVRTTLPLVSRQVAAT